MSSSIEVNVEDESSVYIVGATVTLESQSTTTDINGNAFFSDLVDGVFVLSISASGYLDWVNPVFVFNGAHLYTVMISATHITVTDNVIVSESIEIVVPTLVTVMDNFVESDSVVTTNISHKVMDSAVASESINLFNNKLITDNVIANESVSLLSIISVVDNATVSEIISTKDFFVLTDTATITDFIELMKNVSIFATGAISSSVEVELVKLGIERITIKLYNPDIAIVRGIGLQVPWIIFPTITDNATANDFI